MFLKKLCSVLEKFEIRYALVGGYAVALHGAVRGTVDVDIVIEWQLDTLKATEAALNSLGLKSIIPVSSEDMFSNREHYINNRNLIAWNFTNPDNPTESVDIIVTFDLTNTKRVEFPLSEITVQVLNIDSLIEMKLLASRKQDLADVEALKKLK